MDTRIKERCIIANLLIAIILYSFIKLGKPTLSPVQWGNIVVLFASFNLFIYEAIK